MIVDASAVIAILRAEDDAEVFAESLATGPSKMSAATYVECGAVVDNDGDPTLSRSLDELLAASGTTVVAFTPRQGELARAAYQDFGRGSGHKAKLNFGDCMAYALALDVGEPLLWKGDDFTHTGIRSALEDG